MQIAHLCRLRACDERLTERFRAQRTGELSGFRIDLGECDPSRGLERNIRSACGCRLHELRPDGERGLGPAEADRLIVVEAHPHDREELRSEAGEPGVSQIVGGSRIAGGVEWKSRAALTRGGALV